MIRSDRGYSGANAMNSSFKHTQKVYQQIVTATPLI